MIIEGLAIIVAAGLLCGSVLAPIKVMRGWTFEKSWAVYSVWAYLVLPWLLALLTVPDLFGIYSQISLRTMLICAACGLGWGLAVSLLGVGRSEPRWSLSGHSSDLWHLHCRRVSFSTPDLAS